MADNEKLTPEEEDVRNQVMLQDLRDMHVPTRTSQSLERVRDRLIASQRTSIPNSLRPSTQFTHKIKQGRLQIMHDMPISIARKKGQYLNMLVAGIIAALLVGSLLFVVTHVYQNKTGGGRPDTPQISASKATATAEPAFSGGPGWKHIVTFRGTGNTTITKLHLKFPYAVGSLLVCTGAGDIYTNYNKAANIIGFGGSCRSMAKGELFVWSVNAYVLETISIVADKNSSWVLQLENCVDKSACKSPAVTATPTRVPSGGFPTPMPTLAPIVKPISKPRATPVPGAKPRATPVPGAKPTATPVPG